ncbi:MAG: hypothetical protein KDB27_07265, partial [Planctomycetales bacterium]|nr:hypothetical protein [Planctomycetales bacterium]
AMSFTQPFKNLVCGSPAMKHSRRAGRLVYQSSGPQEPVLNHSVIRREQDLCGRPLRGPAVVLPDRWVTAYAASDGLACLPPCAF